LRSMLMVPAPRPHGLTSPDVGSLVNLACDSPLAVRLSMEHPEGAALSLRRAAVRAESRALSAASIQIRQESCDVIKAAKVLLEQTRTELARLRATRAVALRICPRHADNDATLRALGC